MKEKYLKLLRLLLESDKKDIEKVYIELISTPLSLTGHSLMEIVSKTSKYTCISKDYKNYQSTENRLKLETIIKELETL